MIFRSVYLPQIEFESKNRFFYTYYTAKEEYIYHNVLQYHDFYEIQLFQSKIQDKEEILGYITLSDKKYPITHNALVLINIFEQHKVEVTSENYIRFCIDVMPDFIYFVSSAETNLLNFFQKSTSSPLRILDTKQSEQLIQLFYDFGEPKISNGYDIYKKGVLCMLIAHLFDICYTNFYSSAYYEDKNITLIFEIIQYIDTHIRNKLSLSELSTELHFSTYYLCHSFKKYTNISLKKCILDKKMELAKQLLPLYSVTEVSEKIGFNTYSSFFRVFKKQFGVSPSDFKNKLK